MRHEPAYQPITVETFLSLDFGTDKKFELVDGVIQMMTGGTRAHARVAINIISYLAQKLRGSGCRPYGSDAAIRIDDINLRYPDVSVMCEEPPLPETDTLKLFERPKVIFEVLSPSTEANDVGKKLDEYRRLDSIDTIVFVNPVSELARVVQRLGPTSWRDDLFAQPQDVALPSLGITLPHAEIFARD
ncbi:hypothetical protein AWL63_08910 [Sphingomonas panacis]|uniref:Putative restriction endonuclease domain-containing protein n=1 Tax=Sphingomonas panacis TaxID=1560345 RepID=A0A1B3Z9H4_9SPHN|nr:Uma2 family endonuclease [Sphingomonas panacis]AOH84072.1 hypothetical protein AWL63_08910 [Sphingomonas panacis]